MQPLYLLTVMSVSAPAGSVLPVHIMVTEAQCRAVVQSYKQPKGSTTLPRVAANCYAPDGKIIAGTGM